MTETQRNSGGHFAREMKLFWGVWVPHGPDGSSAHQCCHPPPHTRQRVAPRASGSICFRVAVGFGLNIAPGGGSGRGLDSFAREEGGPRGGPHFRFSFFSFCTLSKSLKSQGPPTGSKNQCFPTADGRSGPTNIMTIGLCPTSPRMPAPTYANVAVAPPAPYLIPLIA